MTYLKTLAAEKTLAERRAAVADLVAPEATTTPPLLEMAPVVSGPGRILAIDEHGQAAAVQVSTASGPVFLELRRTRGRWLVVGLPAPD